MRRSPGPLLLLAAAALCLALFAECASAQATGYAHGGGTCQTDWDCSLGGSCTLGVCVCDAWFTGATCSLLNMRPVSAHSLSL
jgi:hypothetical protein